MDNETTAKLLSTSLELELVKTHLNKMLDEWEEQYLTGTEFSPESKEEYIAAAKYLNKATGRGIKLMERIELTID